MAKILFLYGMEYYFIWYGVLNPNRLLGNYGLYFTQMICFLTAFSSCYAVKLCRVRRPCVRQVLTACHRTNVWYCAYQRLVRLVPSIGTRPTSRW